jgi:cob(I)alamin adenosyltransferase
MMPNRIYTRTGDDGTTGLFGGVRVPKADPRVEAYGEVDELNALVGWVATQVRTAEISARLHLLQADLLTIGSHLATPPALPGRKRPSLPALPDSRATEMEQWIDESEAVLPELRSFILPGGSAGGAALHVLRTVCRRAERRVTALAAQGDVDAAIIVYLNRLSDLLFSWARLENLNAGAEEHRWLPRSGG